MSFLDDLKRFGNKVKDFVTGTPVENATDAAIQAGTMSIAPDPATTQQGGVNQELNIPNYNLPDLPAAQQPDALAETFRKQAIPKTAGETLDSIGNSFATPVKDAATIYKRAQAQEDAGVDVAPSLKVGDRDYGEVLDVVLSPFLDAGGKAVEQFGDFLQTKPIPSSPASSPLDKGAARVGNAALGYIGGVMKGAGSNFFEASDTALGAYVEKNAYLELEAKQNNIDLVKYQLAQDEEGIYNTRLKMKENPFNVKDSMGFGFVMGGGALFGGAGTAQLILGMVPAVADVVNKNLIAPYNGREYTGLPELSKDQNATVVNYLNNYQANKDPFDLAEINRITGRNLTPDQVDQFQLDNYVPKLNLSDQIDFYTFRNEEAQLTDTKVNRVNDELNVRDIKRLPETGLKDYADKSISQVVLEISGKDTGELSMMRGYNREANSKDFSNLRAENELSITKINNSYDKVLASLEGYPQATIDKFTREREEAVGAYREHSARVMLSIMEGDSYEQALNKADGILGTYKTQKGKDSITDYWMRERNNLSKDVNGYQWGLNSLANAQITAKSEFNDRILNRVFSGDEASLRGRQSPMAARMYSALKENLLPGIETAVTEIVGEKFGTKYLKGLEKSGVVGSMVQEGIEEVITNPVYEVMDAASKARDNTFVGWMTNLAMDFIGGTSLGALGAGGNNTPIKVRTTDSHLEEVHSNNIATLQAYAGMQINDRILPDILNFQSNGESIYLSEAGKAKAAEKAKLGVDLDSPEGGEFGAEDFNTDAVAKLRAEVMATQVGAATLAEQTAKAIDTYNKVKEKYTGQKVSQDIERSINLEYSDGVADFVYMGQPVGGQKTYADIIGVKSDASEAQVMDALNAIQDPVKQTKLINLYNQAGSESRAFLNKTAPENKFEFNKDAISVPLRGFIKNVLNNEGTYTRKRKQKNPTLGALNDVDVKAFSRIGKVQNGSIIIKGERLNIKQVPLSAGTTTYQGSYGGADNNFKFLVTREGAVPQYNDKGEIVNTKDAFLANFSFKKGGVPYLASEFINVEEPLSMTDENGETLFTKTSNYSLDSDGNTVFSIKSYADALAALKDVVADNSNLTPEEIDRVIRITERAIGSTTPAVKIQALAAVFSNLVNTKLPSDKALGLYINNLLLSNPFFAKELSKGLEDDGLLKSILDSNKQDLATATSSAEFKTIISGVVERTLGKKGAELKTFVDGINSTALVEAMFNRNLNLLSEQRLNGQYFFEAEGSLVDIINDIVPDSELGNLSTAKKAKLKNTLANMYVFSEIFNSNLSNAFASFNGSNAEAIQLYADQYVNTIKQLGFEMDAAEFNVFRRELDRISVLAGDWATTFNILPADTFKESFSAAISQDFKKLARNFNANSSVDIEAAIPNRNLYFNIALISKSMVNRIVKGSGTQISGDFLMELTHLVKKMDGTDIIGKVEIENFYTSEDYVTQELEDFKQDFRKAYSRAKVKGDSAVGSLFSNVIEELTNAYFINFKYRNQEYTNKFLEKVRYLTFADYKMDIQNPVIRSIADKMVDLSFQGNMTNVLEGLRNKRITRAFKAAGINMETDVRTSGVSLDEVRDIILNDKKIEVTKETAPARALFLRKLDKIRTKLAVAFGKSENIHREYHNLIASLPLNVEGYQRGRLISIFSNTIDPRQAADIALSEFPKSATTINNILQAIELYEASLAGDYSAFYSKDVEGFLQSLFGTQGSVGNLVYDSKAKGKAAVKRAKSAEYSVRVNVKVMDINDIKDARVENESSLIVNSGEPTSRAINHLFPKDNIGFWIDSEGFLNIESEDGSYLHAALRAYPDQSVLADVPNNPNKPTDRIIKSMLGNSRISPVNIDEITKSELPKINQDFWNKYIDVLNELGVKVEDGAANKLYAYFKDNSSKPEFFGMFVAPNSRTLLSNINKMFDWAGIERINAEIGYQFDLSKRLYEELGFENAYKAGVFINTLNQVKRTPESISRFIDGNFKKGEENRLRNIGRQFQSLGIGRLLRNSGIENAKVGRYDYLSALNIAEDVLEQVHQVGERFQRDVDSLYARGIAGEEGVIEGLMETYKQSLNTLNVPDRIALDLLDGWNPTQSYEAYINEKVNRLGFDFDEVYTIKGAGASFNSAIADGKGKDEVDLQTGIKALEYIEDIKRYAQDGNEGFALKGVVEYINGIGSTTVSIEKAASLLETSYAKDYNELVGKLKELFDQGGGVKSPELLAVLNVMSPYIPVTSNNYEQKLKDYFIEARDNNKLTPQLISRYFNNEAAEYYKPKQFTIRINRPVLNDAAALIKGTLIDNTGVNNSQYEGVKIYNSNTLSAKTSGYKSTMLFSLIDGRLLPLPKGTVANAYIVSFETGAFEKDKNGKSTLASYLSKGIPINKKGIHYIPASSLQTDIITFTDTYPLPVKTAVEKSEVYNAVAKALIKAGGSNELVLGILQEGVLPKDIQGEIETMSLILKDFIPNADVLAPQFYHARKKVDSILSVKKNASDTYIAFKLQAAKMGINNTLKFVEDYRKFNNTDKESLSIIRGLYDSLVRNSPIEGSNNLQRSLSNLDKMIEASDVLEERKNEITGLLTELRSLSKDIVALKEAQQTETAEYKDMIKQLSALSTEIEHLNTYGETEFGILTSELSRLVELANPESPSLAPIELKQILSKSHIDGLIDELAAEETDADAEYVTPSTVSFKDSMAVLESIDDVTITPC